MTLFGNRVTAVVMSIQYEVILELSGSLIQYASCRYKRMAMERYRNTRGEHHGKSKWRWELCCHNNWDDRKSKQARKDPPLEAFGGTLVLLAPWF